MPLVQLGYVARPNGLRGAVVAHVDPSMASAIGRGLEVELRPRSGETIRTKIRHSAPVKGGLRLALDGIDDRNASEALVGATLFAERDRVVDPGGDEFLDSDIVGLAVVDEDGRELGRVTEVIPTGANDVYAVAAEGGGEILVPAVAHAVVSIDLDGGRLVVVKDALEYPADMHGGARADAGEGSEADDGGSARAPGASRRKKR